MEKITLPGFQLIGLRLAAKTSNENGQSMLDCGHLWQEFERGQYFKKIPNKIDNNIYAVYYEYEGDHSEPFSYFIGCKIRPQSGDLSGLHMLNMPTQRYCKITAKGKMPDCMSASWRKIWDSKMNRTFGFDFEVYGEKSQNRDDTEVDIYVSVSDHE
ncbi:Predicted transcriptional regulator YdeE, contains AraC-type DNA-binding domain [Cyclobacterium lianum]|uniref:Predicted transcriptional regulator YdeE, contains AraC-type DNA-binding domain n=1 Tax=Cyclobacterium lianum TaxID=388280 RepID=A0A1M7PD03_9BACT|nr:GyrI-like domain-containing protein [Cyclobacterium lianum]SHN14458.1 Predicted transcriptional regulator YdeE, contains AraC-type DNA-binding domain [Cyclobacterium lianum]